MVLLPWQLTVYQCMNWLHHRNKQMRKMNVMLNEYYTGISIAVWNFTFYYPHEKICELKTFQDTILLLTLTVVTYNLGFLFCLSTQVMYHGKIATSISCKMKGGNGPTVAPSVVGAIPMITIFTRWYLQASRGITYVNRRWWGANRLPHCSSLNLAAAPSAMMKQQ